MGGVDDGDDRWDGDRGDRDGGGVGREDLVGSDGREGVEDGRMGGGEEGMMEDKGDGGKNEGG